MRPWQLFGLLADIGRDDPRSPAVSLDLRVTGLSRPLGWSPTDVEDAIKIQGSG